MLTAARLRAAALWWLLLVGFQALLVSSVDRAELAVAAAVALPAAVLTVVARELQPVRSRLPAGWVAWLPPLPAQVLRDTAGVLLAAVRRREGTWREVTLPRGRGEDPAAAGYRAMATLVLSASPATLVVDLDPRTGRALLHELGSRGSSGLERAVAR